MFKLSQTVLFFGILILACHSPAVAKSLAPDPPLPNAQSQQPVSPKTIFLRVNEYYIVYTNPVVPYVDPQGHLMVGLDGVKCIFTFPKLKPRYPDDAYRVSLVEDAKLGTAVFSLAGHILRFTAHSATASVDNATIAMPTAAVLVAGHLVVPLSALAHGLGHESAGYTVR